MPRFFAGCLLLLFTLESTGCYSWHDETSPVPTLENAKPRDVYRVTLAGGRIVNLTGIQVRADSVLATADSIRINHGQVDRTAIPVSFPLKDVVHVEHRAVNGGGVALGVGGALLLFGGAYVLASSGRHF